MKKFNIFFIFLGLYFLVKFIICSSLFFSCKRDFSISNHIDVPEWAPIIIIQDSNIKIKSLHNVNGDTLYTNVSKGFVDGWQYKVEEMEYYKKVSLYYFDNQKKIFIYSIRNNAITPIYSEFDYMGYSFFSILFSSFSCLVVFYLKNKLK